MNVNVQVSFFFFTSDSSLWHIKPGCSSFFSQDSVVIHLALAARPPARYAVVCELVFPRESARIHGTRVPASGLLPLSGIKQRQWLCASRLPAFPVMRSDPFASRGGRTCLYSSSSQAVRGEKQITEALWSNVNTTPHK